MGFEITVGIKKLLIILSVFYIATNALPMIDIENLPISLTYFNFSFTDGLGRFNPIQLLTYPFIHVGIFHLLSTLIVLIFFGNVIEMGFGEKRFLQLFFVSAAGAALISNLIAIFELYLGKVDPNVFFTSTLYGASGATFGILGAFAAFAPDRELIIFPIPMPIKAKYLIGLYGLMQFYKAYTGDNNYVAYAQLAGLLIGIEMMRNWKRNGLGRW